MLWALLHGEHSVGEFAEHVGMQQQAVSQHLARLQMAYVVKVRRRDNKIFYLAENAHVLRLVEQVLFHSDHVVGMLPTDRPPAPRGRCRPGGAGALARSPGHHPRR